MAQQIRDRFQTALPLLILAVYFAVWLVLFSVFEDMGWIGIDAVEHLPGQTDSGLFQSDFQPAQIPLRTVLLNLLAALSLGAPVMWIYTLTRRREGYPRPFVQILVLLPLVVAGVVQVVKEDLALAFALAGIVAAVRFRTTVRDHTNAVFAFAVIGIGLATGSGAVRLAGILAGVFCLTVYAMWKLDIGGVNLGIVPLLGRLQLSEALIAGEAKRTVSVGNDRLTAPLSGRERSRIPKVAQRLAHEIRADALRSKRKFDTLFLVYATDEMEGREVVETVLEKYTERCALIETFPWRDNTVALEYLLRLEDKADVRGLLTELNCGDECLLRGAELKPMKGFRKRLLS